MNWVLEHLQILIGVAAAIAYFLNRKRAETGESGGTTRANGETDEARAERTRRVQEEIRRKIAERRVAAGEASAPMATSTSARTRERVPPLVRPTRVEPIDPFGGPLRRIVREIQEASERQFEPEREREEAASKVVLARQERLAEDMRALEAARVADQRRAAVLLAAKRDERVTLAKEGRQLGDMGAQLRDPRELRRAFLLREVLGAPVALR